MAPTHVLALTKLAVGDLQVMWSCKKRLDKETLCSRLTTKGDSHPQVSQSEAQNLAAPERGVVGASIGPWGAERTSEVGTKTPGWRKERC